jgi:hypothetical protein
MPEKRFIGKELLGHFNIRDTMKYAHFPMEFMKEDVKKLEALDGLCQPPVADSI